MLYILKFPITLIDEETGDQKPATADEVLLTIDATGNSQTKFPRDMNETNGDAMWWEDGAIFVRKMRGSGINYGSYYLLGAPKEYDVHFHYGYDTSYDYWRRFWLNEDGTWYWTEWV